MDAEGGTHVGGNEGKFPSRFVPRSATEEDDSMESPQFENSFKPSFERNNLRSAIRNQEAQSYGSADESSSSDDQLLIPKSERTSSRVQGCESSETELGNVDHCHLPRTDQKNLSTARKQLIVVCVLSGMFMIGEIVGGIYSNSLALLTDATHLASDLASFIISLFALFATTKAPTVRMTFGYHRAEVVGALVSVLLIWVATGVLLYLAVDRVMHNHYEIMGDDMIITAGCGVAFNMIMGLVLHSESFACKFNISFGHGHSHGGGHGHSHGGGHGHSHGGGHSHGDYDGHGQQKKSKKNLVIRAAFIHILGDLIQSVGVLIAAYIIRYKPEYKIADPICTFIFSILVLFTTITVLRDAYYLIMEGM
ncbi:zinc transporter 2-like [Lingula anatina]|uniref:Zinc transporter 2-like n=1 Tax=Lingula anatina TaxID=7574 RepID=A0A1S3HHU0_LINAN|nr:zinc transporter 2-like [Lingula anatina]|eukprot:XP_013385051.1 zinc transporter 2-like [Lingula anatina]